MKFLRIIVMGLVWAFAAFGSGPDAAAATFANGDVFVGVANGQVQWRHGDGTLVQTLDTGTTGYTTGMAFDSSNRLFVTCFDSRVVTVFNPDGSRVGTFGSGYSGTPESIVFDAAGNAYIGDATGDKDVRKFSPAGVLLDQYDVPTERIGSDWVDLAADQCTLYYTSEGNRIMRYNVCTRTQLSDFVSSASGILAGGETFAFRIVPATRQVLAAHEVDIKRISADGIATLQTYDAPGQDKWFALNLDADGTSFWSASFDTADVFKFDISSGTLLRQFNTGTGAQTVFGLAVFGELVSAVPPSLALSPVLATNQVGAPHVVTVTATSNAVPVAGLTVSFTVSGANSVTGSVVTDATGHGQFSYTGTNPGVDLITASALFGLVPKSAIARKIWIPATGPNLSKYNLIQGTNISIGEEFSYEISFDTFSVDVAVVDLHVVDVLPLEVTFLAVTTNGAISAVYDAPTHSVVWDFGTFPSHTAGPTNYITVRANTNVIGGSTIINLASLTSSNLPPVTTRDKNPRCPTCPPGVVTPSNSPPIVVCQSITVIDQPMPEQVGAGSFDPEGGPVVMTLTPPGPYPIGTNPVTLTVTDTNGLSRSCQATVTVLGPRGIKQQCLSDLLAYRSSVTNEHDLKDWDDAIEHLTKSLAPDLWVDDSHLQRKHGERVFKEEKYAVHELVKLLKDKKTTVPDAVLQRLIDCILAADRLLAVVAIDEASAAGVNPKKISEARKELAKGDEEAAEGHPDHAIEHYGHAWKHVRHAKIEKVHHSTGKVQLDILGFAGERYAIQTSADLINWVTLDTRTADPDGVVTYEHTNPPAGPMRFYRILEP